MSVVSDAPGLAVAGRRMRPARRTPRPFRRSPLAVAGLAVVALWVVLAVAAPVVAPYAPLKQDIVHRLSPPNPAHSIAPRTSLRS